jgi:hypothetical protein
MVLVSLFANSLAITALISVMLVVLLTALVNSLAIIALILVVLMLVKAVNVID